MGEDVFLFCKSLREVTLSASFAELPDLNTRMSSSAPSLVRFYGEAMDINLARLGKAKPYILAPKLPISSIPMSLRPKAAEMFAKHREEYAKEAEETYLKYIKSNKKKLWADRDILRQLLEESYITAADLEALLDEAGKREDTETSAMLLEYQEKTLSRKSVEKRFKL